MSPIQERLRNIIYRSTASTVICCLSRQSDIQSSVAKAVLSDNRRNCAAAAGWQILCCCQRSRVNGVLQPASLQTDAADVNDKGAEPKQYRHQYGSHTAAVLSDPERNIQSRHLLLSIILFLLRKIKGTRVSKYMRKSTSFGMKPMIRII